LAVLATNSNRFNGFCKFLNSYSFWAAKNKDTESRDALGLLERQRVKVWLNHAYKEIESLGI
jgi:hypothetical protein